MEKVIKIGKQEVKLNNNVAWTMEYRDQFGKDILPVIMPFMASMIEGVSTIAADAGELTLVNIAEALEGRSMDVLLPMFQAEFVDLVVNVTWAMAKAADEDIAPPKQWVRQFDVFPVDAIAPVIYEMALKGFVSSKNLKRLKDLRNEIRVVQPTSTSTPSSSPDSNED